jgi:transcriptional regulator with XRE-family HTH domain
VEADRKRVTEAQRKAFGLRLRVLRAEKQVTQEQLAERSGIARQVIGSIERAERDGGISHVWMLADALGVEPAALFERTS